MNTKSNETPNHKRTQKGRDHHGPGCGNSRAHVSDSRGVFGDLQEAEMKRYLTIVIEYDGDESFPKLGPFTEILGGKVTAFHLGDRLTYEEKAHELLEEYTSKINAISRKHSG
jgi:hypothetical protein